MKFAQALALGLTLALAAAFVRVAFAQTVPTPSPPPTPNAPVAPLAPTVPGATPSAGSATAAPAPTAAPVPTATPSPPPIQVAPASVQVAVGATVRVAVQSALGPLTVTVASSKVAEVAVDQAAQSVSVTGFAPGQTTVTVTDARGLSRSVAVTVAYLAGSVPSRIRVQLTGDPASADFVRAQVVDAIRRAATVRPDAQLVLAPDQVPYSGTLGQDMDVGFDVPVLLQGTADLEVDATVRVEVENVAVPRISPASLMVSDYPERLLENGVLFTAKLAYQQPSRFLYFHYNPPGQPDRRIVLRAQNRSGLPTILQFISGRGGPSSNEMEAGHTATKDFLVDVVQNQGRLISIPGNSTVNVVEQDLPPGAIDCNLMQLRVLSGADIDLTLFAQNATDDPNARLGSDGLLTGTHRHARGIYPIPEFHYARAWSVTDPYLELPIGQLPLPNTLRGEALSGDYGVLQSFVVTVENPLRTPQNIAIYENPRGGRATGTYLIDGVLVQSHQVPPFSRYKVRQYVVPAQGFVRVTIVTMAEAGSSYPLKLIFAPDDGSVAPNAPGSPVY